MNSANVNDEEASNLGAHLKLVHETTMPDMDEFADSAGADDESSARASALRAFLLKGEDARKAEWRIKHQWPKLGDRIPEIVASAQRTAEKWMPGEERMIDGTLKQITSIELLNKRFVMVAVPGQASCIARISDAFFMTQKDFVVRRDVGDSVIVTGVNNEGVIQTKPAAGVWLGDRRRRSANKIVFTASEVGPECFNLWTGFGVTPKAGKCGLICRHIKEVICAGREAEYKAFLNLLAWQVQNIGKASRIIVVLYSREQQIGKGAVIEQILPEIFGPIHGVFTSEKEHVFGKFNDFMRSKACVCLDEACFAGDKQAADKIKSAAATGKMSIEAKGLPKIQLPAGVNIYMATNHEHAAHVEKDDARYWILKVSSHRKDDVDYWTDLIHEMENGGREAFLHDLLARDVSNFRPQRDVPRDNEEHRANQRASDPTNPAQWLLDCLDSDLWLGSERWESAYSANRQRNECKGALPITVSIEKSGGRILPAFLEHSYREWAKAQNKHAQAAGTSKFWDLLTGLGFAAKKSGGRYRDMPDEKDLRAKIAETLGAVDVYVDPEEGARDGRDTSLALAPEMASKDTKARISPDFSADGDISLSSLSL